MKKKLLVALSVILVLAFAIPAFAAVTDAQKTEILDIHKQMLELRKKLVDKYVEAGELTADEGKAIKDRVDEMEKYRDENGILPGPGMMGGGGRGCGGYGANAGYGGSGAGAGFGGPMMRGGWGAAQGQSI
ncbi:MAG: hypothetical protein CVU89_15495 [Firmicutes bacterium HGW-Firmicutes-14]|jgi:hypothetical protein|nr:MAG: hypothetical protein CVU89_15495 [Firmicutes bacterium HGW-Firmicutes-14]